VQPGLCDDRLQGRRRAVDRRRAMHALEDAGILSWVNRIHRIGSRERDLFGQWATTWRVVRTSNAYVFCDPKIAAQRGRPSNTDFRSG
jgi:hypothetical protein